MFGKIDLEPFGKFTPGEHDPTATSLAFKSDIRSEACNGPFVGTARMLLAEAQVIIESEVGKHG